MDLDFNIYEQLLIAIAACIITVNVYVTSLFVRKPKLRQGSSVLLFSLTMADLFTGLVTVPLIISTKPMRQHENAKFLFISGDIATVVSASLTIMSLCAVTADRYARLCHPMRHMMLASKKRIVALFCFIWITAFTCALIPLCWLYRVMKPNPSRETIETVDRMDTEYSIVGAALFAIPVIGLTMAFVRMFYAIRKLGRDEQRLSIEANQEDRRRKRERKALVLFGTMFMLFMICWLPWITLRPFVSTQVFDEIPKTLLSILVVIRFLTSIINPLLYTLHEQNYYRALIADKDSILKFIQRGWGRQRSTSADSAYKLDLYRSSRKGTFLSTLKSQDDTTTFMPSPLLLRNGQIHSGRKVIHTNNTSNVDKTNQVQDEPSLLLWVPPHSPPNGSLDNKKAGPINWNIPDTRNKESDEDRVEFGNRYKDFKGGNGNEDGTVASKAYEEGGIEQQRSSDLLGNPVGWEDFDSCGEKLKLKKYKDMSEPLLGIQQEETSETMAMLMKSKKYGHHEELNDCLRMDEEKLRNKEQTKSLLKTSFIGKLFNADDIDAH